VGEEAGDVLWRAEGSVGHVSMTGTENCAKSAEDIVRAGM